MVKFGLKNRVKFFISIVLINIFLAWECNVVHGESSSNSNSSTVYIIRHGEKKWLLGCLSKKGEARANALKSIFQSKFTLPNHIFANYYDDHIDCERCIETVTPVANSLGLKVNSSYGYNSKLGGNEGAANAFKDTIVSSSSPQTLLIAWEHINIKPLTESLGVPSDKIPTWKSSNFDSVYVLKFNSTAHLISFNVSAEGYGLSKSKEEFVFDKEN